ncbi:MAG: hypothetical protein M9920_03400 [Verrucomicrobiae bacterium]|nr:hypothetical protein [Verrucomicrobiae bacterium]
MKNLIIGILLIACLASVGMLYQARRQTGHLEARLIELQHEVDAAQATAAEAETQRHRLSEALETAQQESLANASTAAQLMRQLTNRTEIETAATEASASQSTNQFASAIGDMLKNPEMRDLIRSQQKAVMGGMVDKSYAEFFKSMNLTPEQTATLKDLIMNKMLAGADLGMQAISGEMTSEERAELTKRIREDHAAVDEQIKALLGDDNYAVFQDYEKSIPDRMAVDQFKAQLGDAQALNSGQEQLLIAALTEERRNFHFTTDFSNQNDYSDDAFSRFNEANVDQYFLELDQLNQRYLERAQSILSPAQYEAYTSSLKSQQDMMRIGMKMAAQMFGKKP